MIAVATIFLEKVLARNISYPFRRFPEAKSITLVFSHCLSSDSFDKRKKKIIATF